MNIAVLRVRGAAILKQRLHTYPAKLHGYQPDRHGYKVPIALRF